jgi:hypothetical protein
MLLIGLGGDAQEDLADLELGSAEEVGGVGADQGAGDLEELLFGSLGEALRQQTSLGFLGEREVPA